ncbi:MAG: hypothetical protein HAW65_04770 [Alphaproteobacteria bacterium]|nr:hypothetical protein [Alphaproteobacteria bacterium]MBE8220601.1 hypothetical protein [Alphaproteobacteria bacterium]
MASASPPSSSPILPSEEILTQLQDLSLDPNRPLIISDADEVLLHFMERLEHFLERKGLWIDLTKFAISGNIRSRETNELVEVPNLVEDFFATETLHLTPTQGAAESLAALAPYAQIIIFTNLPLFAKAERVQNLASHGMDYPVIVGSGLKGVAVGHIARQIKKPVFFLDDIPHNIDSVAEHSPDTHRIHFVADTRLAARVSAASHASARIDVWSEAYDWIKARLDG